MYLRVGSKVKMKLRGTDSTVIGEIIEIKAFDLYKYVIRFRSGYKGSFRESEFELIEF